VKILAYIGTFNEEINRPLEALLRQTHALDQIVIVDNASTHSAPSGPFPAQVALIRSRNNLGPSGAITNGLQYGLQNGFDWMWVFDADSAPRYDALEKLVALYHSLDAATQREVGILSCSQILAPSERVFNGRRLTVGGPRLPRVSPSRPYCECDSIIWSGSLFKLDVVRKVGMPRCGATGYWEDFGHDNGDVEFSFRIRQAGYRILVHRFSLVDQCVGQSKQITVFGRSLISTNHPPGRRYLFFRNLVYFWIYLYPRKNWIGLSMWFSYRFLATILMVLFIEDKPVPKIVACSRGVWAGLRKKLYDRYER
jgi:rhamnosyltransferase